MAGNRQSINVSINADAKVSAQALKQLDNLVDNLTRARAASREFAAAANILANATEDVIKRGFSPGSLENLKEALQLYKSLDTPINTLTNSLKKLREEREKEATVARLSAEALQAEERRLRADAARVALATEGLAADQPTARLRQDLVRTRTEVTSTNSEVNKLIASVRNLAAANNIGLRPGAQAAGSAPPRSVPTFLQFSLFPVAGIANRVGAPGVANAALAAGDFIGLADALGILEQQVPKLADNLRKTGGIVGSLARAGTNLGNRLSPIAGNLLGIAAGAAPFALALGGLSLALSEAQRITQRYTDIVTASNQALLLALGDPSEARSRITDLQREIELNRQVIDIRQQQLDTATRGEGAKIAESILSLLVNPIAARGISNELFESSVGGANVSLNAFTRGIETLRSETELAEEEIRNLELGLQLLSDSARAFVDLDAASEFSGLTTEELQNAIADIQQAFIDLDTLGQTGLFDPEALRQRFEELQAEFNAALGVSLTDLPGRNDAAQAREAAEQQARRIQEAYIGGFTGGFELTSSQIQERIDGIRRRIEALTETIPFAEDAGAVQREISVLQSEINGYTQALNSNAVAANDAAEAQARLTERIFELARIAGQATFGTFTQTTGKTLEDLRTAQEELAAYNQLLARQPELAALFADEIANLESRIRGLQAGVPTTIGQFFSNPANRRAIDEYRTELNALQQAFVENARAAAAEQAIADQRDVQDFTIARRRAFEDFNRELQREQEDELRRREKEQRQNNKRLRDFEDRLRKILEDLLATQRQAVGNRDAIGFVQAQEQANRQIRDLERSQQQQEEARQEQLAEEEEQRDLQRRRREEDFRLRLRREDEDRNLRFRRLQEDLLRRRQQEQIAYNAAISALNQRYLQESGLLNLLQNNYTITFSAIQSASTNYVNTLLAQAARLNTAGAMVAPQQGIYTGTLAPQPNPYQTQFGSIFTRPPMQMTPAGSGTAPMFNFQILGTGINAVRQQINRQLDQILRGAGF